MSVSGTVRTVKRSEMSESSVGSYSTGVLATVSPTGTVTNVPP